MLSVNILVFLSNPVDKLAGGQGGRVWGAEQYFEIMLMLLV